MSALAHRETGAGPRPVILLHGFLGSARNLGMLARRLAGAEPALRVVTLDLTGHGASPPLPPDADLATLARDVLDTARGLRLDLPLAIIGHSLGGRVALRAGLLEPAAIGDVTLLDISPSACPAGETETAPVMQALLRAPDQASARAVFRHHLGAAGLDQSIVEWLLTNLVVEHGRYGWRIDRAALAALRARTMGEDLWPAVEGPRRWTLQHSRRPIALGARRGRPAPRARGLSRRDRGRGGALLPRGSPGRRHRAAGAGSRVTRGADRD